MPRRCTVCAHRDRPAIDKAIIGGSPLRRIAMDHGLSESAVRRHASKHLPDALVEAAEAEAIAAAGDLIARIEKLHREAVDLLEHAGAERDYRGAAGLLREGLRSLQMLATIHARLEATERDLEAAVTREVDVALDRLEAEFRHEPGILERALRAIAAEHAPER